MRLTPSVAVLVAVVVAVGCGAGHPDTKAQPCRAKDLRPDADARKFGAFQPQAGAAVGGVVLQNQGSRRCVLRGRPVVELRPTYGQAQRLVQGTEPAPSPPVRIVLLRPRHSAVLGLSWANWCRKKFRPSWGSDCEVTARSLFGIQARPSAWLRDVRP